MLPKILVSTLTEVLFALPLFVASGVHSAGAADTPAALTAIADTADRICGIVATQGEAQSSKVSGDVHGELAGLARRLASIGVSGKADIASTNYQNVLQEDLASTLKDVRNCKQEVFKKLVVLILPGTGGISEAPGAPSADLLQSPSSANLVDFTKNTPFGDVGLYSCVNVPNPSGIKCYGTLTRTASGAQDYNVEWLFGTNTKLVDNFHVTHELRRATFIDGLGGQQSTINLSTGEGIWWALDFESGPRQPSSARILGTQVSQLRGPVK